MYKYSLRMAGVQKLPHAHIILDARTILHRTPVQIQTLAWTNPKRHYHCAIIHAFKNHFSPFLLIYAILPEFEAWKRPHLRRREEIRIWEFPVFLRLNLKLVLPCKHVNATAISLTIPHWIFEHSVRTVTHIALTASAPYNSPSPWLLSRNLLMAINWIIWLRDEDWLNIFLDFDWIRLKELFDF